MLLALVLIPVICVLLWLGFEIYLYIKFPKV
jgi:hypothetical protein